MLHAIGSKKELTQLAYYQIVSDGSGTEALSTPYHDNTISALSECFLL